MGELVPIAGERITVLPPFFFRDHNERFVVAVEGKDVLGVDLSSSKLRFRLHHKSKVVYAGVHPVDTSCLVTVTSEGELGKWMPGLEHLQVTVQLPVKVGLALGAVVETSVERLLAAALVTETGQLLLLRSLTRKEHENPLPEKLATGLPTAAHEITIAQRYCAYVKGNKLHVRFYYNKPFAIWHKIGDLNHLVSVAVEQSGASIAASDNIGRILIWRNVEEKGIRDVGQLIHWHTLGPTALVWAPGGAALISGGAERVLVRHWLAREGQDSRETLPRLPAAVERVGVGEDGRLAIGLADNSIRIVSADFGLAYQPPIASLLAAPSGGRPIGLVPDPCQAAVWTNATPGYVQQLCPYSARLLAALDVAGVNDPPAERSGQQGVVTVVGLALTPSFLLTLHQLRDPNLAITTSTLQLWHRSDKGFSRVWSEQRGPGQPQLNSVALGETRDEAARIATMGEDGIRLWATERDTWLTLPTSLLSHQGLHPRCVSISDDGSVVGAGFGSMVTLWAWTQPPNQPKLLETRQFAEEDIRGLGWSGDTLVVHHATSIHAWDTGNGTSRELIAGSIPITSFTISGTLLLALHQDNSMSEVDISEEEGTAVSTATEIPLTTVVSVDKLRLALGADEVLYRLCEAEAAERIRKHGIRIKETPAPKERRRMIEERWGESKEENEEDELRREAAPALHLLAAPTHSLPPLKTLAQPYLMSCLTPLS